MLISCSFQRKCAEAVQVIPRSTYEPLECVYLLGGVHCEIQKCAAITGPSAKLVATKLTGRLCLHICCDCRVVVHRIVHSPKIEKALVWLACLCKQERSVQLEEEQINQNEATSRSIVCLFFCQCVINYIFINITINLYVRSVIHYS